jgi:hypothetical protein
LGSFFHSKIYVLILTNKGLGYILGEFLTNGIWSPCWGGIRQPFLTPELTMKTKKQLAMKQH